MLTCYENKVRKEISLSGHNIKSFAGSIDVSYTYMSNILNGRACSGLVAKRIAEALDVEISDIFEVKESIREEV
ncbi:hypothetical protein WN59_06655 [Salinicoccus sediminis]|uniref:HTH cro/C1-type domain-containing protein n=1 Tax=Salinicoccus sediminis TaxID=1432562 RepID=A0A0M2SM17_9STAP|nr:helix-turn-helix transcriptional regulator [Salinicoccus sediminis]KKK34706.1 hypothetical protein WN59_06655 [Salinicoccus sediminis]